MRKILNTLKIIISVENTITTNEILHGIRSIPLIGKYIPEQIYSIKFFKIIAFIISVQGILLKAFLGKICLFGFLFFLPVALSFLNDYSQGTVYSFAFLVISLISVFLGSVFSPTLESEYCVAHMGMDAKEFIMAKVFISCFNVFISYFILGIPTAIFSRVNWFIAILIPFAGVGFKVFTLGLEMTVYALRFNKGKRENKKGVPISFGGNLVINALLLTFLMIGGFICIPLIAYYNFYILPAVLIVLAALSNIPGIMLIRRFPYGLYRAALFGEKKRSDMIKVKEKNRNQNRKKVEINKTDEVKSGAKGYRYLNELFIKRHSKILWKKVIWNTVFTVAGIALFSALLYLEVVRYQAPEKSFVRGLFMHHPGFFPFVLYMLNTGSYMSHAMFANCDSSLLMFAFYKQPKALRTMYRLRVASVIKFNLIPTILIAVFSVFTIYFTGGEEYVFQWIFTVLTIVLSMILFSIRHMFFYYMLQPYSSDFMVKSKVYGFLTFVIETVIFVIMCTPTPAWILTIILGLFSIFYFVLFDKLVYKFAPKTFRIK